MDQNYIDRYLVVDRYVAGDLTEAEMDEFEERLVWDEALVDDVETAQVMREAMQSLDVAGQTEAPRQRAAIYSNYSRFAMAASFVLGVALTFTMLQIDDDGGIGPARNTDVVPLMVMRSAAEQEIEVSPDNMLVLMVDVVGDYPSYRVRISRRDEPNTLLEQADLRPGYTRALAVGLPGSLLPQGRYVLSIEGHENGEYVFVRDIPFKTATSE